MLTVKKVFAFLSLESLSKHGDIEAATFIGEFDYRQYGSAAKGFVFLAEQEISYQLPDNLSEVAVESLEVALSEMRAKHHKEQQEMIDRIAGLRQLAAPKEGELVDDRDLREGQRIHREMFDKNGTDEEAEDAQYSKIDDFPF